MRATASVKKAPPFFVVQVVAMELLVIASAEPVYVRAFAWYKLVQVWAGLRYSDLTGAPFKHLVLDDSGLEGRLDITKTTGPGKP
eukprot:1925726-Amphidinium_carterae.1